MKMRCMPSYDFAYEIRGLRSPLHTKVCASVWPKCTTLAWNRFDILLLFFFSWTVISASYIICLLLGKRRVFKITSESIHSSILCCINLYWMVFGDKQNGRQQFERERWLVRGVSFWSMSLGAIAKHVHLHRIAWPICNLPTPSQSWDISLIIPGISSVFPDFQWCTFFNRC